MSESGHKRQPSGHSVADLAKGAEWPFPTWIEDDLWAKEFATDDAGLRVRRVLSMFDSLGAAIDRAFAGDNVDDTIKFEYWRKLSETATKMKPAKLQATVHQHPDYLTTWMLVERQHDV
jgi:hypothetical protein